jgi:hypothetical protein
MVGQAILRWGSRSQRERWLPGLASGEIVAAFALTEPEVGSDARHIQAEAIRSGDGYEVSGRKMWITFGQLADLFLVFAQQDGRPCAFLIERGSPGLSIEPTFDMLGCRASMLAELTLKECRAPGDNLIGGAGFGFVPVALSALNLGRYTVAWGCVGLAQACLETAVSYSNTRRQFGVLLKEHQLIQQMITRMAVNVEAARLLCFQAGELEEKGHGDAMMEVMMAKYFASTTAVQAAGDAAQILGAAGMSGAASTPRYLRDAKIMEIIEGSTQIHEIKIAEYVSRA